MIPFSARSLGFCRLISSRHWASVPNKGLVTNYGEGGLQNGRGGHVKFDPYKKGEEKVLAMLKFRGSFYVVA